MAREAPINWRKPRRETESSHSDAPLGNSRCSMSWNSGDPASSSKLRQYSGPFVSFSWRSTVARSIRLAGFLPGQTSSRFDLAFSIFVVFESNISAMTISAMTSAAARDVLLGTQLIFLHQGGTERVLVGVSGAVKLYRQRCGRLLVAHVENLLARAQKFLRRTVAVETPLHLQRCLLVHERHLVHGPVAVVAANTLGDMNAVVEINEVRQLVDARPLERLAGSVAGSNGLKHRSVGPNLRVAVHAGLGGRNACETRLLHRSVTVAAVDAKPGHVVLVAEGHGLRFSHSRVGDVGRALELRHSPEQGCGDEDRAEQRGP